MIEVKVVWTRSFIKHLGPLVLIKHAVPKRALPRFELGSVICEAFDIFAKYTERLYAIFITFFNVTTVC